MLLPFGYRVFRVFPSIISSKRTEAPQWQADHPEYVQQMCYFLTSPASFAHQTF